MIILKTKTVDVCLIPMELLALARIYKPRLNTKPKALLIKRFLITLSKQAYLIWKTRLAQLENTSTIKKESSGIVVGRKSN
jgi:hypothetical protein